ncbi:putative ZWF1-glucose-6-phosphate dehydrogenase [Tilletiaria anomala UBC 951]|uniref:Glucose-6-phosphate 1-dehydrogenase n=1 Tax=Tilletiaria anomala (strain ATCC 24038 / CBS 436.72 / UBC 951) TaxID=1037660 RepID=A0A066VSV5_TILAU|nr:putative ZWF1-glucose-6-phosphate dehydrogenase [Tilletiaria anomala UBC 951]KDN41665.1 putative ZWF1-glucose-6-phosphate dehydrogenase [Tilletiaria anomala UBC 951]
MAQAGMKKLTDETAIVVLGASGDLAKKKTYPALFNLFRLDLLPKGTSIIGYARTKMDQPTFHGKISQYLKNVDSDEGSKAKAEFLKLCTYLPGAYDEDAAFKNLNKEMEKIEQERGASEAHRLFYMALPPNVFTVVAKGLKNNCYSQRGSNRIVIEKPFGKDLDTCREMMGALKPLWKEEETFRIDHYLGKEMVKNILIMRFGNPIIDATLNSQYVDNVQITFKEPFGTEGRGGYFDEFGIVRDIQQNHLSQVLSLLAMERPKTFGAEDIRDRKVEVLQHVPAIKEEDVLIGQYTAANGKPGYKDDDTVPKDSNCPTFAALTLWINSQRWKGVPFVLKAGKALDEAKVEIRVQYKDAPGDLFGSDASSSSSNDKSRPALIRNELVLRIQPNEAVYFKMNAKAPGLAFEPLPADLDLTYKDRFSDARIPEAYEALILDALQGDHSNFVRDDELDVSWKIFTPILHAIDAGKLKNEPYQYGSRGPASLDKFVEKYGFQRDNQDYEWPKTNVARKLSAKH